MSGDARLGSIRLSLLAAVGALVLSTVASGAVRAAPQPGPSLTPAQAPSVAPPPSPAPAPGPSPWPARAPAASPGPVQAATLAPPSTPASQAAASVDPAKAATPLPSAAVPAPSDATPAAGDDAPGDEPVAAGDADGDAQPDWQAYVPTDVADHLATMDRAAQDSGCGVPWHLLAAIGRVESDFGRNMATSSAGAVGYGQFLPSSWQAFGNDGNVYDYRDALPAIATYLCHSGLERDPRAALYAYNHADWYVDLVLDLAVRYDRMAPGAPTPDVLDVAPATAVGPQMLYAPGRDVRLQGRARSLDTALWLGVPWSGRAAGVAMSFASLETSALTMVRAGFGRTDALPTPTDAGPDEMSGMGDHAWQAGLLATPIELPRFRMAADRQPAEAQALLGQIRRQIAVGRPVIALVDARSMPGHPPDEAIGDQPVVIVGQTADGLVYNDPTFSSSLGYGLEFHDADFLKAWQSATTPLQALAFTTRPRPLPRDTHLREAEPPPVYARVIFTPTATPVPATPTPAPVAPLVLPAAANSAEVVGTLEVSPPAPQVVVLEATPDDGAARGTEAVQPVAAEPPAMAGDDRSWVLIVCVGVCIGAALALRRRRVRSSS